MELRLPAPALALLAFGQRTFHLISEKIPSRRAQEMVGFALRNWLASMLAFYLACTFQLESPHWAWVTVWIVAQPTPGMVLSKSLYRVLGSIAGSLLAIVLIAVFAQSPEYFVLALALLVGLCTYFSQMLTNFRSYATVLAAYTAGIVAADAINTPDQVFFIALARASCILIGIASSILVTSLLAPHRARGETIAQLRAILEAAAQRAGYSWRGDNTTRLKLGRALIQHCIAVDTLIEFAAAESGTFRLQTNGARSLLAHVFGLISARRALDAHLLRHGWPRHHALNIFHEVIIDFLNELPAELESEQVEALLRRGREITQQLAELEPEAETVSREELISERFVIDRLHDLLFHLEAALEDWRDLSQARPIFRPGRRLNFHRDLRAARINGLRAFLAVCATGAFWIATAWPDGPAALVFVCVLLSLFSAQPHPDRVGWIFFYAGTLAACTALFCKFYVLPNISNFETLALVLGLFLIPLGFLMANPPTTAAATSFSLVFLNLTQPANPMVYDFAASLNNAVAILLGVLFGTLAFVSIFPPDPRAARQYVTFRIQLGLEHLARLRPIPLTSAWETRMFDRIIRLNDPANLSATPTDEWLDAGLGALTLGNDLLRVRHWLAEEPMPAAVAQLGEKVIAAFSTFLATPQQIQPVVREQVEAAALLDPGLASPMRRIWARLSGALLEIEQQITAHPQLLHSKALL